MCIKVFPTSSQVCGNFCSDWDKVWVGHRDYSIPPHVMGEGILSLPGRKDSFQLSRSDGNGG